MFKSSSDQSPNFKLHSHQALPVREERSFQTAQQVSCLLACLLGLFSTSLILLWQPEALTLCNVLQLTGHSDKSSHLMRECHLLASTISCNPSLNLPERECCPLKHTVLHWKLRETKIHKCTSYMKTVIATFCKHIPGGLCRLHRNAQEFNTIRSVFLRKTKK